MDLFPFLLPSYSESGKFLSAYERLQAATVFDSLTTSAHDNDYAFLAHVHQISTYMSTRFCHVHKMSTHMSTSFAHVTQFILSQALLECLVQARQKFMGKKKG